MICKRCKLIMTWAMQKRQYWRLVNDGYTKEQARELMPLCGKCVTRLINDSKRERLGMFITTPDDTSECDSRCGNCSNDCNGKYCS